MSNYKHKIWEESLLPFEVIEAVVKGDTSACEEVLCSFNNYIEKLCTRTTVDENGRSERRVNLDMKQAVEQKLLYAIANKFEMLPLE